MTIAVNPSQSDDIFYPSSDGEPIAETYDHVYAIFRTLIVLTQYLQGQRATVLANQFLYYSKGLPKLRTAPDVMVIFDVEPGGRDNYKIWEEDQVPTVIFEMTSPDTREQDLGFKKGLYAQLGVQEYWLFDPKGEWIPEKLNGYQLQGEQYIPITDSQSTVLNLALKVEDKLIGFYRNSTGKNFPPPQNFPQPFNRKRKHACRLNIKPNKNDNRPIKNNSEPIKNNSEPNKNDNGPIALQRNSMPWASTQTNSNPS
jgi:Uma2 family endonuclease